MPMFGSNTEQWYAHDVYTYTISYLEVRMQIREVALTVDRYPSENIEQQPKRHVTTNHQVSADQMQSTYASSPEG